MKQEISIVTDSGCDLPQEILDEFGIEVVPLTVHFGEQVYLDGEMTLEEFWQRAAGPEHPKTSQPAVGLFDQVFERLVAQGKQVLCVVITSQHSGTINAANAAAERFGEAVQIFDSLSLSLGLGLQALVAAQAARAGRSLQDILALLEDLRARVWLAIVLDTLENLRRGGRADGFIAVADRMTRALNIKVIINLVEGQLRLVSAARSFKGGLQRVFGLVERMGQLEHLAVVHARSQETAEKTADQLAERTGFPRERIWVRETGTVLACHAGPGVVGIMVVPAGA
jgi:DegV family protein with EDD domain